MPPDDGDATHIDHARRLLTQIYYRQNREFTKLTPRDTRTLLTFFCLSSSFIIVIIEKNNLYLSRVGLCRLEVYVMSAQFYDGRDLGHYLAPIIVVTSCGAFLGFLSSSSVVDAHPAARTAVGLLSGLMGVLATTLTALRNAQKFDVKAEMFRSAAGACGARTQPRPRRLRAELWLFLASFLIQSACRAARHPFVFNVASRLWPC